MNPLFRRSWIIAWPLSFKLLMGFIIAAMIPTIIALVLVEREVRAVDVEDLRAYVGEKGRNRQQDVVAVFGNARIELTTFVNSFAYRDLLVRILAGSENDEVFNEVAAYLDEQLVGTGLFSDVRILSLDGEVLLSSGQIAPEGRVPSVPSGTDQSDTQGFLAAQTAVSLRQDQRLTLSSRGGVLVIEIAQVFYRFGEPFGFIIGAIDYPTSIVDLLVEEEAFIENYSYLVTEQSEVIAPPGYRANAIRSAQVSPVEDAVAERSGTAIYEIGREQFVAHYAPVTDTPFAIITETAMGNALTLTLADFAEEIALVLLIIAVAAVLIAALATLSITPDLQAVRQAIEAIERGEFEYPVHAVDRGDEVGGLARAFVNMRDQMLTVLSSLEANVSERVRDVQATQEVSRFVASQRDMQLLMDQVVELITRLFPTIYHAQIFLVDADREYAALRASTGEAGQQLLSRGHRLEVGGVSVIGQVTEEGRVIIARDTAESEIHRQNEFLRATRAELAIPLRVGEEIIGALDVQSKMNDSFTEDLVNILQTMADQIAIAIENARLYEESVRRLEELAVSNQQATRRNWQDHLYFRRQQALVHEVGMNTDVDLSPLRQEVAARGEAVVGQVTDRDTVPFAVPIVLRGQAIGSVEWELPAADFSQDKVQLAQELVNRLAISLDNARLFQESRRAIDRERLVNEIASKLTGQTDIDEILQTAVREVGQALQAPQVHIQLKWSDENTDGHEPDHNGSVSSSTNGNET